MKNKKLKCCDATGIPFYTTAGHQKISAIFVGQKITDMKLKCVLLAVMSVCSVSLFAQSKTDTVKVWGNCEECKNKIAVSF